MFKFVATSILSPSNLNALIIFCILGLETFTIRDENKSVIQVKPQLL